MSAGTEHVASCYAPLLAGRLGSPYVTALCDQADRGNPTALYELCQMARGVIDGVAGMMVTEPRAR